MHAQQIQVISLKTEREWGHHSIRDQRLLDLYNAHER